MVRLLAFFLAIFMMGCLGIAGTGFWAVQAYQQEGPLSEETIVLVSKGSSVDQIGRTLASQDVISNPFLFKMAVRMKGVGPKLKAGEFSFPKGASLNEVIDILIAGKSILHKITIPEGLTSWQVVQILNESQILTGEIAAVPPEGTLLPETYVLGRGESRQQVLDRMQADLAEKSQALWAVRKPGLPFKKLEEAINLAALVEKETAVAAEREIVASVYVNRLNKGMLLQADPTIVYYVTKGKGALGRGISKSELKDPHPFNTYVHPGLPPTPIANPGLPAVAAVLNPADTEYLFFVADGTGGHFFSKTYDEHKKAVKRWRTIEQQRRNQNTSSSSN